MIDSLTNLDSQSSQGEDRQIRRLFYEEVLGSNTVTPGTDLQKLCSAWLKATGADWVWLWLKHEDDERESPWELTSAVAKKGEAENLIQADWHNVAIGIKNNVSEFCSRLKRPVFVDDVSNWRKQLPGEEGVYRVGCADELLRRNCHSFLAVPLFFQSDSIQGTLKGQICAHFVPSIPPRPRQSEESLTLMARATSQAITASFSAAQHRILLDLNRLTTQYLTTYSGNIAVKRHDFLMKVVSLAKEHVRVQFASVFYRTTDGEQVVCLATTGLQNQHGQPLTKLSQAKYAKNEGITGTVFATGEPVVSKIGRVPVVPNRAMCKWRETSKDIPEDSLPWISYPIQSLDDRTTLGVLRCVGNRSFFNKSSPRNFDPIQLETLGFIARQLAPVLETLASYINRERVISIIKHDLAAPLKMIEDSIAKASAQLATGRPPNEYFVSDLQCCILTAKSLAQGLDQSPTEFREFDPQPTWMEGDIVAVIQSMLTHYAKMYNDMEIRFNDPKDSNRGRISEGFPKRLWLDRNLISRSLTNLIVNAVKYGEPNTIIYVSARKVDGRGFYLDVENRGVGIRESEKHLIFDEGYRSSYAEERVLGLGMGLPIARAIMEKHKGRLDLVSLADPTVFSMFFPFHLVRP